MMLRKQRLHETGKSNLDLKFKKKNKKYIKLKQNALKT
jgi:hypothetical protein